MKDHREDMRKVGAVDRQTSISSLG